MKKILFWLLSKKNQTKAWMEGWMSIQSSRRVQHYKDRLCIKRQTQGSDDRLGLDHCVGEWRGEDEDVEDKRHKCEPLMCPPARSYTALRKKKIIIIQALKGCSLWKLTAQNPQLKKINKNWDLLLPNHAEYLNRCQSAKNLNYQHSLRSEPHLFITLALIQPDLQLATEHTHCRNTLLSVGRFSKHSPSYIHPEK